VARLVRIQFCLIPVFLLVAAKRNLVDYAGRIGVLVDRVVAQAGVFVPDLVHLGAVSGAGDRCRARENERCQAEYGAHQLQGFHR